MVGWQIALGGEVSDCAFQLPLGDDRPKNGDDGPTKLADDWGVAISGVVRPSFRQEKWCFSAIGHGGVEFQQRASEIAMADDSVDRSTQLAATEHGLRKLRAEDDLSRKPKDTEKLKPMQDQVFVR